MNRGAEPSRVLHPNGQLPLRSRRAMLRAGMDGGRSTEQYVHVLACAACPRVSSATARGWRAYLIDEGEHDEEVPGLVFYCPPCAELLGGR